MTGDSHTILSINLVSGLGDNKIQECEKVRRLFKFHLKKYVNHEFLELKDSSENWGESILTCKGFPAKGILEELISFFFEPGYMERVVHDSTCPCPRTQGSICKSDISMDRPLDCDKTSLLLELQCLRNLHTRNRDQRGTFHKQLYFLLFHFFVTFITGLNSTVLTRLHHPFIWCW